MKALTSNQLAYIAGLFDGEGTLVIGKYAVKSQRNLAYRGFMAIANTHIPTLIYIKSLIGGSIVEQGIGKKCYSLSLSANQIRVVLPELLPYLSIKREQAEVILKFFERQASRNFGLLSTDDISFYEECYQKAKSLKLKRYDFKEKFSILGTKKCLQCGTSFESNTRNTNRKYCSDHCGKKRRWTYYNGLVRQKRLNSKQALGFL